MKIIVNTLLAIAISMTSLSCDRQKRDPFNPKVVYHTHNLVITQVAENSFVHTSFLQTNNFGYVPCNGLIVSHDHEPIVFDTPTDDKSSEELIRWITGTFQGKVNGVVATHFHGDYLGGLKAFEDHNIPTYAHFMTVELARENNFVVPKHSFKDSLVLKVGRTHSIVKFFGEGHTKDNVVGYFPNENVLFGGCLIKELGAGKGYLGDANLETWSATVEKVKKEYPNVKMVVPGHGAHGNIALLDYTINLFRAER